MRLQGKRALVTGAASGIGRAVLERFVKEGAIVIGADIAYPGSGNPNELHLDVTVESDWESAMAAAGQIDIMVACAGISDVRAIADTDLAAWRRVIAVNVEGGFLAVKHAAQAMRPNGGTIVLVGSASGVRPAAQASAYCTSKAALRMFAKAAALELKPENIRVNCVSPGGVVTPMWRKMPFWEGMVRQHGSEEAAWNALGGGDPEAPSMQRMALPAEIAEAILFLSCSESAHITGIDLLVDAGYAA